VIWIVAEDARTGATLARALAAFGRVVVGAPERARFADAPAPDLLVLAPRAEPGRTRPGLERMLEFVRGIEPARRAPPPALFLEPEGGEPSAALARALIDDRPLACSPAPPDPDRVAAEVAALLARAEPPPSLRARARRGWVDELVEIFYASLELPSLRQAIDPRNAARPVLFVGEAGTARGLLARYVHQMAEPPRTELIVVPAAGLPPGSAESELWERSGGRRVSIYLDELDRAEPRVQEEIAASLAGGLLGVESIRWLASLSRRRPVAPALRGVGWLRVELPALRDRADLPELVRALARSFARRSGRDVQVSEAALAELASYGWPRNLWELRDVLEASLAACSRPVLEAEQLRFEPGRGIEEEGPAGPPVGGRAAAPAPVVERAAVASDRVETAGPAPAPALEPPAPPVEPAAGTAAARPEPLAGASIGEIAAPLAQEIRKPMLAIRTYASALERGGDEAALRRGLGSLVETDLSRVEEALRRLEQFASFGPPARREVDLTALVGAELERRRGAIAERELVILEELDRGARPVLADEEQLRFAIGSLLDRALRMVPAGGDLYVGTFHHAASGREPAHHRLLIRFHSPEDVLVPPAGVPGPPMPLEVVLARALVERAGGRFAVDASGAQDNVMLIDLPA
jgi:signal transduction histidine kinase